MTIVNGHGETPDEEQIRLCMDRLCRRYNVADTGDIRVRDQIRVWFEARMEYLTEEYRCAINANDSIIAGRQQLFNSRPKLKFFPSYR